MLALFRSLRRRLISWRCFGRDEELVEELEEDLVALRLGLSAQLDTKGVET